MKNIIICIFMSAILTGMAAEGWSGTHDAFVYLIKIDSSINPGVAEFLARAIKDSESAHAEALVVELDTPGGLADSMREMIKNIMESSVPIVVYVAPSGARAASAGVMITIAAHVAVMAPGTNIGAASPVAIGPGGGKMDETMKNKVMNDMVAYAKSIAQQRGRNEKWAELAVREAASITDIDAVIKGVVDLRAIDVSDLLNKIDGRQVEVAGKKVLLRTKGADIRVLEERFREKFLRTLANPNIAYLLMLIGLAGLYFELSSPGVILPGAIGALSLILAFYALNMLPVNYAGILLILLGVILFIAEIKIASFGFLIVGGILCLLLGSIMLFRDQGTYLVRVSWEIILPTVAAVTLFFTVLVALVVKSQVKRPITGARGLIGERGVAKQKVTPEGGKVFVHGEYWNAVSDEPIEEGISVEVVRVDQLKLVVKRTPPAVR